MKGKILIALFIVVLGCISCVREYPISEEEIDITVTASFATAELQTKAGEAEEANDKTINNGFLAAFKKDGTCLGMVSSATGADLGALRIKTGDITFIGLANANGIDEIKKIIEAYAGDVKQLPTLEQLMDITTSTLAADKSSLIKMIKEVRELKTDAHNKSLTFNLSQLSALVEVKFEFSEKVEGREFVLQSYSIEGINTKSKLVLETGSSVTNIPYTPGNLSKEESTLPPFYTYEVDTEAHPIVLTLKGNIMNGETVWKSKTYTLTLNPKKDNVDSKTDGIVHGYKYTVTGKINMTTTDATFTLTSKPWIAGGIDFDIEVTDPEEEVTASGK